MNNKNNNKDTPTTTPVITNLTVDSKSSFVLNPRLDNNSSKNNSINMNGSNDSKMNINAKSFEPTTTASTATTTVATTTTKKIESNSTQHGNVNLNTPQPKNFDSVSELSTTSTMCSNPSLPSYNISKANSNGSELPSSSTDSSTLFDFDNSNILNMEAYNTLIKNSNTNHNNINFTHSLDNSKYNYCASPSSSNNSRGPSMDPINNIMERNESNDFRQTEMIKGQITEDSVNHNLMNRTINNHSNDFIYYNNSVQSTNPINNGMNMSMYYSSLNPLINVNNNSNSQLNSQISSSKYSSLSVYSTMDSIDKSTPNTPNSIINSPCPMNASVIPSSSYMNEQDHSFTNPNYSMGTNVNWIKHHSSLDKLNMMKMAGNGMNFNPSDTISDVSTINKMKISNSMDDYSFSMLPQNLHNINKSNSVNHPIIPNQMKTMNHSEPLVERDRNNFPLNYYSMMNGSIDNHRSLVSNPNFMNTNLSCNNVNDTFSTNENDDYLIYKEKDVDMERAKLFSAFANPKFHHMNDYLRTVQNYNTNEVLNNSSMNTRLQEKDAMTAAAVNMNMLQASFSNNNQYRKSKFFFIVLY